MFCKIGAVMNLAEILLLPLDNSANCLPGCHAGTGRTTPI
jgi:hypothetical protein